MSWNAIQLKPGVDTQMTLSANTASVSQSQLIRYKEGLIQTYGGWQNFANFTIGSTIRDLHAWQDIAGVKHLGVGATQQLAVITSGSLQDITPQITITNPTPNFSIVNGSCICTIVDNSTSPLPPLTVFNTIYLNTPVAVGAFLLNGAYSIHSVTGSSIYTIALPSASTSTVTSSGILPKFAISSGSGSVTVTLPNNNFQVVTGLFQQFIAPTTVGSGSSVGIVVSGKYQISSVIDTTNFTINAVTQSATTATATMNASLAQIEYFVTIGPPQTGVGFGAQAFGGTSSGGGIATGFGGNINPTAGLTGTPIVTTDWSQDNWGEVLLACPKDGPIYTWSPDSGLSNATVITTAPFFNGGIFVSMPQQILVAYRSVLSTGVQDPLVIRWSNEGDYTNWTVSNQTTAGSFHFSSGSQLVGAIQGPQFALVSTDIEVWTMSYVGGTVIFNFTKVGVGCGWISSHACGILSGNPFWMGTNNFFALASSGVTPLPCSVWDQVFQNLSTANQTKVRVAVNSPFNEVAWFYPSANGLGENDSYVKVHIEGGEYEWDYGTLSRTAWTDVSVLGMPLGADNSGQIYQQEMGTSITGAGLPSFQTGYFAISEGEEIPFVDLIIPDFIYGLRSAAQNASINITFYGVDYPGDTPTAYGPFTVTQGTDFINCRIRNRLLSAFIQSNASSAFWRLGRIRFRFGRSGRR